MGDDELHVGPLLNLGAAAAGSAEEGKFHGARIGGSESRGQLGDKMVRASKADLRVVNAEGGHALQQADGVGQGDIDVGLLHSVAQTGVKQLDMRWADSIHAGGFLAG